MLICLSLLTYFSGLQGQTVDPRYEGQILEARAFLDSLREAQGIPAVSVAAAISGRIIWSEAFGYADVANDIPATTETKFRTGSVGKPWTSLALGKLYDEGKLDFDDSISSYLDEFRKKKYEVTVRQVAGHMGGVRHYKGFEFLSNRQYKSVQDAMEYFIEDPLKFEPGSQYSYSTYGYVVLGRVLEKAAGKEYLDFMSQEVFQPLGMQNTVAENSGADESNKAVFYTKSGKRKAKPVNQSNKWPAGGFLSTPTDMVNSINYAVKIVSPQTLYELITPQRLSTGDPISYAMGWRIASVKSGSLQLVYHGGRSVGARAFLLTIPEKQFVIAICTNMESDYGIQEVYDIAKLFIE